MTRNVLIFDSDYPRLHYLKDEIEEQLGWRVRLSARTEVLRWLAEERFDLLVVDLMILQSSSDPEKENDSVRNVHFEGVDWKRTGLELVRRVQRGDFSTGNRGTPPDVPVIYLTAIAEQSIKEEAEDTTSYYDYVEKPFILDEVMDKIREVMGES